MTLRDEDVGRIGEYVKPLLRGLVVITPLTTVFALLS